MQHAKKNTKNFFIEQMIPFHISIIMVLNILPQKV